MNGEVSAKLSNKYVSINTNDIREKLEPQGFTSLILKKKHALGYHQVKFLNNHNDGFVLENSYDGSRAFVATFIKQNANDSFFAFGKSDLYQKHMGKPAEDLKQIFVEQMNFYFKKVKLLTELMKSTNIDNKIMEDLLKYGFTIFRNNIHHTIDIKDIMNRFESRNLYDVYANLHKILNDGDYNYINANGKCRKARKIKNYQRYLKLSNEMYYFLITKYPELSI